MIVLGWINLRRGSKKRIRTALTASKRLKPGLPRAYRARVTRYWERRMKRAIALAMILVATAMSPAANAQQQRKTPYWASISASEALMRTGPAKTYPAKWLYRRADLPIKVLEVYPSWRKVQD